tara:strand:- start:287 stop:1099 length:813 start_codon:yes stop_codon:yes gene_type:complete
MTVTGSTLINTSSTGLPGDTDDRPFSFAIGTQIFLNPVDDPTDAVASFKFNPDLIASTSAAGVSIVAIGLATDAELDSLATWGSGYIGTPNADAFPVGFCRLSPVTAQAGVNAQGAQVSTLGGTSAVESVSLALNTFTITAHPFATGDRVLVSSTGTIPGGLSSTIPYFVIVDSANTIKFAVTAQGAQAGTEVDIQTIGSGTIQVASDEIFTLTRTGSTGSVTLKKGDSTIFTFTNTNSTSPLRLFYWCREQSISSSLPIFSAIKVRGAL